MMAILKTLKFTGINKMDKKQLFLKMQAKELGLSVRELLLNYDIIETSRGFYLKEKPELIERQRCLQRQDEYFWR